MTRASRPLKIQARKQRQRPTWESRVHYWEPGWSCGGHHKAALQVSSAVQEVTCGRCQVLLGNRKQGEAAR